MAIKLLDVDGTPAIPGTDNRCQDFLTVNHPVFPFATPAEYVKLFDIRATPLGGDLLDAAWLAVFHPQHAMIATEILLGVVASPLFAGGACIGRGMRGDGLLTLECPGGKQADGGINRLRQAVNLASQAKRAAKGLS